MTRSKLNSALSRHLNDMSQGFSILTNYGELQIQGNDAAPFVRELKKMLEKKLKKQGQ